MNENTVTQKDITTSLILGIVGLALGVFGYSSIAGLVVSIIGFNKAKKVVAAAPDAKMARIGKNLALAGIIVSAVALVIVIIVTIVGGCASALSNY